MNGKSLYNFYEYAVLPQFGVKNTIITWNGSQQTGPDESVHYFSVNNTSYALIFEDAGGLGQNDDYIHENVLEQHSSYSFVQPIAATSSAPSYDGFHLPAPYQYCENVTGSFTLLLLK
jgi:hypothetical protein